MIEYRLSNERDYQHLKAANADECFVKRLTMYSYGDAIEFSKINKPGESYGSYWDIPQLSVFSEFKRSNYTRLNEMDGIDLRNLAFRISKLLFRNNSKEEKILMELESLQKTQTELWNSGAITTPKMTERELQFGLSGRL